MSGKWIQCLALLQEFFQGAKSIVMQTAIVFRPKFWKRGGWGESLHLSRGLLRNKTDVKLHKIVHVNFKITGSSRDLITTDLRRNIHSLSLSCSGNFTVYRSGVEGL